MKPISLQLYSLRQAAAENLPDVLRQVAEIGYKGVEFAGLHDHAPKDVRKMLDDLGLVASSAHMPLPVAQNVNEIVDVAGALGLDVIVAGCGPDRFKDLAGVQAAADEFETAAELLRPHGLTIAYHNHWWEMAELDGQYGLELLLARAPDLNVEMDVYWACGFGKVDVPALIDRYKARMPLLHLKDGPLVQDQPHTAVGAGRMDIPACVSAADENVLNWVIVELDDCATDMLAAVRESCLYLVANGLGEGNCPIGQEGQER